MNPHQATKEFERALCAYTGAPYAVAVNSCTMALLLAVAWHVQHQKFPLTQAGLEKVFLNGDPSYVRPVPYIEIPKRTYVGVPMSIIHAGGRPTFRDEDWRAYYCLEPLPVYDSARWFTANLFHLVDVARMRQPKMVCVSFHALKTLGDTQGGAILLDDYEADQWLRRARFDGRTEGIPPSMDKFTQVGWHCYLSPDVALRLLWKLQALPKHNEPLPNDDYPDLSLHEAFR